MGARAKTKEEYIDRLTKTSFILNPPVSSPKSPPKVSKPIYGLEGMKAELENIISKDLDAAGRYLGRLEYARWKAREAHKAWRGYRDAQPGLDKKAKPTADFLDRINAAEARVAVLEKESWQLHRMIKAAEKEITQKEEKKRLHPRLALAGKMKGGRLVQFGGREVTQDENGKNIFKDDGTLVDDYIAEVRGRIKRARQARQQIEAQPIPVQAMKTRKRIKREK